MENRKEVFMHTKTKKPNKSKKTVAGIINFDNRTVCFGVAQCCKQDTFLKSKGRSIAIGRATKCPFTLTYTEEQNPFEVFREQATTYLKSNLFPTLAKSL